jgi:hypothetical protein
MVFGGIYGAVIHDRIANDRQAAMEEGFSGKVQAAKAADQVANFDSLRGHYNSSHSHLALFGLIALALGGSLDYMVLPEIWLRLATLGYIIGAVLFPVGGFLQLYSEGLGRITAMVGGFLLILAMIIFLVGAFKIDTE